MEEQPLSQRIASLQVQVRIARLDRVPPHWKLIDFVPNVNRLYYILDGEGSIRVKDRRFQPGAGQMVLMPAGVIQSYQTVSSQRYLKYWCHFTATVNGLPLFQLLEVPHCVDTLPQQRERLAQLFASLISYAEGQHLTDSLRVHATLLELICLYIECAGSGTIFWRTASPLSRLQPVLQYIDDNMHRDISVDELAQRSHFHPAYFCRFFKTLLGLPPSKYMKQLKLERAKELLLQSDRSIADIAEALGMEGSAFSKTFKKHGGYTPGEYRKLMSNSQPGETMSNSAKNRSSLPLSF